MFSIIENSQVTHVHIILNPNYWGFGKPKSHRLDLLHRLLSQSDGPGMLGKIGGHSVCFSVSMYADDAAIFIKPTKKDIDNLVELLKEFGNTTGLHTNITKTTVTPICCVKR